MQLQETRQSTPLQYLSTMYFENGPSLSVAWKLYRIPKLQGFCFIFDLLVIILFGMLRPIRFKCMVLDFLCYSGNPPFFSTPHPLPVKVWTDVTERRLFTCTMGFVKCYIRSSGNLRGRIYNMARYVSLRFFFQS